MQFLFSYTHIKLNLKFLFPFIRLSCVSICYQWALIDPVGNHSLSMDTSNPNTYKIYSRRSGSRTHFMHHFKNSLVITLKKRSMLSVPESKTYKALRLINSNPVLNSVRKCINHGLCIVLKPVREVRICKPSPYK